MLTQTQTQTQPKNIFSLPMPSNGPFQESRYPRSRMQVYGRAIVFRGKGLVFRVTVPTLAFGFRGAHDIRYSASLALWVNLVSKRAFCVNVPSRRAPNRYIGCSFSSEDGDSTNLWPQTLDGFTSDCEIFTEQARSSELGSCLLHGPLWNFVFLLVGGGSCESARESLGHFMRTPSRNATKTSNTGNFQPEARLLSPKP